MTSPTKHSMVLAGEVMPDAQAVGERADGSESLGAQFVIPLAANEVVDDGNCVALLGQVQGCGPTAISVSPSTAIFILLLTLNSGLKHRLLRFSSMALDVVSMPALWQQCCACYEQYAKLAKTSIAYR